jgi:Flp pilus assembly protein TadG
MIRAAQKRTRRSGATTVEFAVVSLLVFTFLFAIFEYGRFLFMYHITTNAARDAARFAVVRTGGGTLAPDNTSELATITVADVQGVMTTGLYNSKRYGTGMNGMEHNIVGYTVDVYAVSNANLYATPPNLSPTGAPAWTTAAFHQKIAVRVTGSYKPILPSLIGMSSSMPFQVIALAGSEAN